MDTALDEEPLAVMGIVGGPVVVPPAALFKKPVSRQAWNRYVGAGLGTD